MDDQARIRALLAAVRARLRWRQAAGDLAVAAAAGGFALLLLLLAAAGRRPSDGWRSAGFALLLGGVAMVLGVVLRALFSPRFRDEEPVARFVAERSGVGDDLLSAVELARALPRLEAEPETGSAALARAHLERVAARLGEVEPRRVVALTPAWPWLAPALGMAGIYLALLAFTPDWLARGLRTLRSPPDHSVPESAEPLVADLEIRLTYPPHTGLPPRVIPGSSGEVLAPPGTQVALRARPLVPVRAGTLELSDGDGKPLESRPAELAGGLLLANFPVEKSGTYRFSLQRESGGSVREGEPHRIEVEADRSPRVDLAAPADDLEVQGPRRIQLAYSADDDYGLTDLELVWRSGAGDRAAGAEERKVVRRAVGGRSASGSFEWDLAELDLPAGARLTYHLEARDNDAVSGPNIGSSRSFTVRVYSPEEKHEELLAAAQAILDGAVALLGDRLELGRPAESAAERATPTAVPEVTPREAPPASGADKTLSAFAQVHARSEGFLGELGRLQSDLDKDPLAPKDLKPTLAGIHVRLGKLVRDEAAPIRELKSRRGRGDHQDRALRDGNGRHVAELERDAILLDDLIRRQRLEQLLSVTDQMERARDRLQSLLSDYKKSRSDAIRKEIEREMRRLERQLAELEARASKLSGELPDEFVNREALGDNDLHKRLDAIRELLEKGDVDKAIEEMKQLSASLDRMVQGMEGNLRSFRDERFSAEEKALAELENRLADLEQDQRQIQSSTEGVRARYREEVRRLARDRVAPLVKRARERVAELKKKLASVDRDAAGPFGQEDLDKAKRRVDDIGNALDQEDLDQAREAARGAADQLHGLSERLRGEEERRWEGMRQAVRKARERVDESEPIARKLAEEIEEAFPRPDELLPPTERRTLDGLSSREEALRRRTDEARRELERRLRQRMASEGKASEGALGEGMKEAGEHMRRATEALKAGNPRDSVGEEGEAADQLGRMRRQVQQERRPRNEGAGGGRADKEPVRIPGADDYRAPREFREDLLDAMKREAPKEYRDQVKRYYEELVR